MTTLVAAAAHPFVVAAVAFGSLVITVNLAMLARGKKVQRGLLIAVTVVTLGAAALLGNTQ